MKTRSLTILLTILLVPLASYTQTESLAARADSLFNRFQEKEALQAYTRLLETDPNHYRGLWRASLLNSRVGNRQEGSSVQRDYFNRARELAERALAVDSTDAESNFAMAVAMGRMALISGARDRVAASREIKKYAQKTLELKPNHAGALHVMGRWHFKIANLSFVERLAANTLFGGIPGPASNESAAEFMEKAISLNDQYILYFHDLATVYEEMGRDREAIATCRTALNKPYLMPGDAEIKQQCRELIEDLQ